MHTFTHMHKMPKHTLSSPFPLSLFLTPSLSHKRALCVFGVEIVLLLRLMSVDCRKRCRANVSDFMMWSGLLSSELTKFCCDSLCLSFATKLEWLYLRSSHERLWLSQKKCVFNNQFQWIREIATKQNKPCEFWLRFKFLIKRDNDWQRQQV